MVVVHTGYFQYVVSLLFLLSILSGFTTPVVPVE
jgi:hypothetical protein